MIEVKPGMVVLVENPESLIAGTVVILDPQTNEVGVRVGNEIRRVSGDKIHLSFRKGGNVVPRYYQDNTKAEDLEAFVVAIAEGHINESSIKEVAEEIKNRRGGVIQEIRTQVILGKHYR